MSDLLQTYESQPDTVGRSGSAVYRLRRLDGQGPDLFLKHGQGPAADDVTDEMVRLQWLRSRLPVPKVVHFLRSQDQEGRTSGGDEAWLLTTALPGRSAYQELQDGRPVVDALADFLRRLHDLDPDTCPFVTDHPFRLRQARANIEAGLVDTDDFDDERQGWSAEQVWQELLTRLPIAAERVVTHGDFSLDNLLLQDGVVTGVLDVGRLGLADRYQDLGIAWNALGEFGPQLRTRFLERYGITEPDARRLSFHVLLDELF